MPHSGQNGFAICHLTRTMAIKVCLYDPIYIHTSYLHSYECQLTCNILELLPRLLCNPPTHPPPFCPSLSSVPTHYCSYCPIPSSFLHVVTDIAVPSFFPSFCCLLVVVSASRFAHIFLSLIFLFCLCCC